MSAMRIAVVGPGRHMPPASTMPIITRDIVGEDRYWNDAYAHTLVDAKVPLDEAVRLLLAERARLLDACIAAVRMQPPAVLVVQQPAPGAKPA